MQAANPRWVAFDLHKQYVVVGAVNNQQEIVLTPRRVPFIQFERWVKQQLRPDDHVVLEASINVWYVFDYLVPLVAEVMVVHPYHVKLIAASMVKTDKIDTLVLARLLAAHILPAVWVPPAYVRDLRALVSHRQRLVKQRTAAKNRLRSVLHRHNIVPPGGHLFSKTCREWWDQLPLPRAEKLRVRQDFVIIDSLSPLITEVEGELAHAGTDEHWADQVPFLIQLPGIGMLSAMTILSAIGDITRFPTSKKLVGYSGLGARVHRSGQVYRTGGITKQGRSELRAVMIEAAWAAVRTHPRWRTRFERLKQRIGVQKAIVAMARKLLVIVWNVLSAHVADRQADPQAVARSLMTWGARHSLASNLGLSRTQFVRRKLDDLGLGQSVDTFMYCGRLYQLPSSIASSSQPSAGKIGLVESSGASGCST